ncbi:MAG: hypothetical protein MI921_09760 [Cytophagales bacterium]|nr:hypothetical protein [Cytophagales bacterium]
MPIQKLNRVLKQYTSDLRKIGAKEFIDLVEKLVDEPILKPVLQINFNLQFEDTQLSGDLKEVKNLIEQVGQNEKPYSFSVSISTNANPRKQLSISASFGQNMVTFNLQNVQPTDGRPLLEHFMKVLPEVEEVKSVTPPKKKQLRMSHNQKTLNFYLEHLDLIRCQHFRTKMSS